MRKCGALFLICGFLIGTSGVRADLDVNVRKDKVVLVDGSELEGIVLAVSVRNVLIVQSDPADPEKKFQVLIPREKINRIVGGKFEGTVTTIETDTEFSAKVIKSGGKKKEESEEIADELPPKEKKSSKRDQAAKSSGKKQKPDKAEPSETAAIAGNSEKQPPAPPVPPAKKADAPLPPSTTASAVKSIPSVTPSNLNAQQLASAYMMRFPDFKTVTSATIGNERLTQMFEQARRGDASARPQVEGFLKLFVGSDPPVSSTVTPSRPMRKPPSRSKPPLKDDKAE